MALLASLAQVRDNISNTVNTVNEALASAGVDVVCSIYNNTPGFLLQPFLAGTPGETLAAAQRGFLDDLCNKRIPGVPQRPRPVTGGQCPIDYNVALTFTGVRNNGTTLVTNNAFVTTGPFSPVGMSIGSNGISWEFNYTSASSPAGKASTGMATGSTATFINAQPSYQISVTPVTGNDNCGNFVPPNYTSTPPPVFPININKAVTNNYTNNINKINLTIPITNITPIVNNNPQFNISPRFNISLAPNVNIQLGAEGVSTIEPAPDVNVDLGPIQGVLNAILQNTVDIEGELVQTLQGEVLTLNCDGSSSEVAISSKPLTFIAQYLIELNQVQGAYALRSCEVPLALTETVLGSFTSPQSVNISSDAKKVRIRTTAFGPNIGKRFSPGGTAPLLLMLGAVSIDYVQGVSIAQNLSWEDAIFDIDEELSPQAVIVKTFQSVEYTVSEFVEEP